MCFNNGAKQAAQQQMAAEQAAAAEARAREAARAQRINTGNEGINSAFSGFGDDYYGNYKNAYLDVYNPEVDKQFGQAQKQLQYGHERAGTFASSQAAKNLADLLYQNDFNKASIASKADAAAGDLRQNVAQQKQSALNQLYSTENPDIATNQALNSVRTIQDSRPEFSPLGDLFKIAAIGGGNFLSGYGNSKNWGMPGVSQPPAGYNVN